MKKKAEATAVSPEESVARASKKKKSSEALLGTLLFFSMILFVIASLGAVGWGAYSLWHKKQSDQHQPSIASLSDDSQKEAAALAEAASKDQADEPEKVADSDAAALASAQSLDIKVLNGGAAKGTAGIASDYLKGQGFKKVTAGNTIGNYSGTVVYYDSKSQDAAGAVQKALSGKYPSVTTQAAVSGNQETSAAPVTVIFGK